MSSIPIVHIKQGSLKGKVDRAYDGSTYFTFHNIPYAQPPLGPLRFKAPLEAEPWQGIRDATEEGDQCYSRHQIYQIPTGSEDCLTLNVFSKSLRETAQKPVMVFIHGGGFVVGSSKVEIYGPDFFMCEDIVFVSINFRIGIFGFLNFIDKSLGATGNAGLKDQVMALRWVQNNIRHFGGNPNNVTIFGESSGAVSVNCHLCSPKSSGLFHKAILQSGSTLNSWCWGRRGVKEIAKYFGIESQSEKEVFTVLQNVSKEDLLKAQLKQQDTHRICNLRPFGIVVEGPGEDSFLPVDPIVLIKSGNYNKVPIITGFNSHEGMLLDLIEFRINRSLLVTNFEDAIPAYYNIPRGSSKSLQVAEKIKRFYYGKEEPSLDNKEIFHDLHTDIYFLRGIYKMLEIILATNPNPCYFYRFSVDADLNIHKKSGNINYPGATHGDELFYMFKTMLTPEISKDSIEDKTIRRFIKYWTNFAKNGDPNFGIETNDVFDRKWPKTDRKHMWCLDIGESLEVLQNVAGERMNFWETIENSESKL